MKGKRHTIEEKVHIMRDADGGKNIVELCRGKNISEQTFHRWKRKFGMMEIPGTRPLKKLVSWKASAAASGTNASTGSSFGPWITTRPGRTAPLATSRLSSSRRNSLPQFHPSPPFQSTSRTNTDPGLNPASPSRFK